MRLINEKGIITGTGKVGKKTIEAKDIVNGVNIPRKIGVRGFGKDLPWRK